MTNILGINAYHGDASSALLVNGELTAAVEEERFNRIKHWAGLPTLAAAHCLKQTGIEHFEHLAVSRDPSAHLGKKAARVVTHPGLWAQALARTKNLVSVGQIPGRLADAGIGAARSAKFHCVEHHRSHLASAFFVSPFEEAAVVSIDGFGDFSSLMWGVGTGNHIDVKAAVHYPHSLGLYYTAFTQFLGFLNYGDEYKMMGMSAYGEPTFIDKVRNVVKFEDGQVLLNLDYFTHDREGVEMTWVGGEPKLGAVYSQKFIEVFGPARVPRTELTQRDYDMAASVQAVLEEVYFAVLTHVSKATGKRAICLAGGVALNCVANGMVFDRTDFRDIYVQPAAHDAGTSIGAALYVAHQTLGLPRRYEMKHVYYGPTFEDAEIRTSLDAAGVRYHALDTADLVDGTAKALANGQIVGWFQGAMEFGPRALGNRSILADPRRSDMKDTLNSRIKYREPFRPFCPSILSERVGEYFETDYASPFMVMAYRIRPHQRARIPAVTHGDGTGRLQTVDKSCNPLYWSLIRRFEELTDVPVLLNTSFNENEPIVNRPAEAIDCFLRTRMDILAIGNFLLHKDENLSQSGDRRAFAEDGQSH
jgi:carbamoyltransferase